MKRKVLVVVSLLLILSLGTAVVAEAAEVEGRGRLWAKGIGYAEIHGSGVVNIEAHGAGTVRVKGAEVLRAQGQGRRWDLPDGTTVFAGWRGHIHVEGRGLAVNMLGGIIEFTAQGAGSVFLKGRGHYWVNGQTGRWTLEGVRIPLVPPAESE
jgi:hypothetical protein